MNEITVYVGLCVVVFLAITADRRRRMLRLSGARLTAWLTLAAAVGFVVWTSGFCALLPLVGSVIPPEGRLGWGVCFYAGGLAAAHGLAFFLPLYSLLLVLFLYRFEREQRGWALVVKALAMIALPLALWLLKSDLAFSFGDYGAAVPRALMAFVAAYLGLLAPRLLPPLRPGRLVRVVDRPTDA